MYSNESIPWRWYDLFNFTYTNWAKDEPKNYGKNVGCYYLVNDSATEEQQIVAMKVSLSDGTWYSTQSFDDLHYYVCKVPPTVSYCPEALAKECGTSDLFKSNKFLNNIKHPSQKFNIPCACVVSLGNDMGNGTFNITTTNPCNANSAIFNHSYIPSSFHSYEESMYYYYYSKYFYGYGGYCFGTSFANMRTFVGLRYDENIKNWTWIDGTVVDYLNWAPGYPKNPDLFGKCAYFDLISGVSNQIVNDFCYSNGSNNKAALMWCYYIGQI
uniref:C-type lectin domain-containing protein n=1 Tax=Acrobeloides nanus TaxID=290746 RepID=A0A914EAU8_9BILA